MNAITDDFAGLLRLPADRAEALVVILHGVGSSAAAMQPLVEAISKAMPDVAVAAPDGTDRFDMGPSGRQWFSVRGVTEANRGGRVDASLPAITAMVDSIRTPLGLPAERVAFVGFSQGAIIALQIAATLEPPAAVVAFAGRLATQITSDAARKPPILLSHGAQDAVIPLAEARQALQAFAAAGYPVELRVRQDQGHGIDAAQIEHMVTFLMANLGTSQVARP